MDINTLLFIFLSLITLLFNFNNLGGEHRDDTEFSSLNLFKLFKSIFLKFAFPLLVILFSFFVVLYSFILFVFNLTLSIPVLGL